MTPVGRSPRRIGHSLARFGLAVAVTLATFLVAEACLRVMYFARDRFAREMPLPYVIGDEYGPKPPWRERVGMLERDGQLIWKGRAHAAFRYVDLFTPVWSETEQIALFRQFWPALPAHLNGLPRWQVRLNTEGFRDAELPTGKDSATLRIVCLGDSWTFGANVDETYSYPRQLERVLRRRVPHRRFEVYNLGVMGYSSFQGRQLLARRALALSPDVVVIGFGMNDSSVHGYHDADVAGDPTAPSVSRRGLSAIGQAETLRLLHYVALRVRWTPTPLSRRLMTGAKAERAKTRAAYEALAAWTRVPLDDYQRNLSAMVRLVRDHGGAAILTFNEVSAESPYRDAVASVAQAEGIPFVDSSRIVRDAKRRLDEEAERAASLRVAPAMPGRASDGPVEIVFRVRANGYPVPRGMFIAGRPRELGEFVPNTVALYDDGTHGDERAGDGVWSRAVRIMPQTEIAYVYTNSGAPGHWEGLDVPSVRTVVAPSRDAYLPLETFGAITLQADAWHTNAVGYGLIAEAIADAVVRERDGPPSR